jgi:hypothetical protein
MLPTFYKFKLLFSISSIYCLLSNSLTDRINSFDRRCLRMIYHIFEYPTNDLHIKFRKSLVKRLSSIERKRGKSHSAWPRMRFFLLVIDTLGYENFVDGLSFLADSLKVGSKLTDNLY